MTDTLVTTQSDGLKRRKSRVFQANPRRKVPMPRRRTTQKAALSRKASKDVLYAAAEPMVAEPTEIEADADEPEDEQMEWMSERLRGLIEAGQQALGKEIVVQDDSLTHEDQGLEDDGSRDWEDEGAKPTAPASISRSSSRARTPYRSQSRAQLRSHPSTVSLPALYGAFSASSASLVSVHSTTGKAVPIPAPAAHSIYGHHARGTHPPSAFNFSTPSLALPAMSKPAVVEDMTSGSPQLRETMERVRRERRGFTFSGSS